MSKAPRTAADILNRWAKYAEYDPEQKRFNLLSANYLYHRCCERIECIVNEYDPSGILALIYAKGVFERVIKESKTAILPLLEDPTILDETREMWALFHSEEEAAIEDGLLTTIERLEMQVTGKKMLGTMSRDDTRQLIYDAAESIVEELQNCHTDIYKRNGPIGTVTKFSTSVHVFNRLSECLLALESAEDGIYLCYIAENNTADCYFGFFLKSNGNLLSVNERIDEAYIGQHAGSRNGRWSEEKKYTLFPYRFIFNFAGHDYLGYAAKHLIDQEKLAFSAIGPGGYLPIVLGMVLLSQKFHGKEPEGETMMVNTLMPVNILAAANQEETALVPASVESSALVASHAEFTPEFSLEEVMQGTYPDRVDKEHNEDGKKPRRIHRTCFVQTESAKLFIGLYGEGFQFQPEKLLQDPGLKMLSDGQSREEVRLTPELVGDKRRMNDQAYFEVRKQLAEYIRDRMRDEFVAFGGSNAIKDWWEDACKRNGERIDMLAKKAYQWYLLEGPKDGMFSNEREAEFVKNCMGVSVNPSGALPEGIRYEPKFLNATRNGTRPSTGDSGPRRYLCRIKPGVIATVFVTVEPKDWKDIEYLLQERLPKIVTGWVRDRHSAPGNPLLDATDKVSEVGTPLEYRELCQNRRYQEPTGFSYRFGKTGDLDRPYAISFNFGFSTAYSKRGITGK